jgi:hypothetical protein
VRLQWNVGDLAVRRGIDDRQCAASITDEHSVGRAIHTNVVGIVAEIDFARCCIIRAAEQKHRSVTGISDKKCVARWDITDTLGLLQSGNDVLYLLFIQIDDSDGIVAKLGHEKTSPG